MTDAELHWLESNNHWRKLARQYARPTSWFDDDLRAGLWEVRRKPYRHEETRSTEVNRVLDAFGFYAAP